MHQKQLTGAKRGREDGRGDEEKETLATMEPNNSAVASKGITLQQLADKMADFAKERDWDKFHSPRNLLLALVGEVGELSEIFQWKGEVERGLPDWDEAEKQHLGEELSDVLLYLVRLSDICGIDLGKAALRKIGLNARKYPVDICKESSKKHTQCTNNVVIDAGKERLDDDSAHWDAGGV